MGGNNKMSDRRELDLGTDIARIITYWNALQTPIDRLSSG